MKYFVFLLIVFSTPVMAQVSLNSSNGITSANRYVVSGDSVIDDKEDDTLSTYEKYKESKKQESENEKSDAEFDEAIDSLSILDAATPTGEETSGGLAGQESIPVDKVDAFKPAPEPVKPTQPVKRVVKTTPTVQIQLSISDDRIDDSYVQGLIKHNFSSIKPIE